MTTAPRGALGRSLRAMQWMVPFVAVTAAAADDRPVDFRQDIAPIFEARCVRCHQPGNKKGDVSVATAADLVAGEYVVAGRPDESGIIELVAPAQPGARPRMPKTGQPLTDREITLLRKWIAAGAKWPADATLADRAKAGRDWWSLRPLAQVSPPSPPNLPTAWRENPIDRFIFEKLNARGLTPSPAAEPRSIVRRLSYDLTGLPPSHDPELLATWIGNPLAAIDRLLASPRYGERWGRHWLDVVRFGESNGYERNVLIDSLWPFRDYVIRSFNDDKPFSQMIREHLYGDALGPGDPAVEAGVAFLVAGPYDDVGNQDPAQAAQIRADDMDEMIRTTSEAFLGLTIGCARCHDHKFDPIAQTDYYRLYATFAGVGRGNRTVATAASKSERTAREQQLQSAIARIQVELRAIDESILARGKSRSAELEARWTRPAADRYGTEDRIAPTDARFVRLTVAARDDDAAAATNFHVDEFEIWSHGPQSRNVALASAGGKVQGASRQAQDFQAAYRPDVVIDGKFDQRLLSVEPQLTFELPRVERIDRFVFSSDRQRALKPGHGESRFIGEYSIAVSVDGVHWRTVCGSVDRKPSSPQHRRNRLLQAARTQDDERRIAALRSRLADANARLAALPALPQWWVGNFQKDTGPFHVFVGGNPLKKGPPVEPGAPLILDGCLGPTSDANAPSAARRQALADWIVAPNNPLPARVLANRLWHYHFGVGLVDTPGDFGFMGSQPTHPELLDWLAGQIKSHGWRLKPLHRLIVSSQTYRQSAAFREDCAKLDADARLLWRFPPRRLSGEEIRDGMLSTAGKLDLAMGGPGFRLYRYLQDNVSTYVPLDVVGPETYRRAVYHQNARAARVDFLTDFDAPDCAFSASKRAATTTPLQALTLLNHAFTDDMAGSLAARLERETGQSSRAEQVRRAYELVYFREPATAELATAQAFIVRHGLQPFCRALYNSNEWLHLN